MRAQLMIPKCGRSIKIKDRIRIKRMLKIKIKTKTKTRMLIMAAINRTKERIFKHKNKGPFPIKYITNAWTSSHNPNLLFLQESIRWLTSRSVDNLSKTRKKLMGLSNNSFRGCNNS